MMKENRIIEVSEQNLPLSCPPKDAPVWCSHPREFLHLDDKGQATCPYCGTQYRLKSE